MGRLFFDIVDRSRSDLWPLPAKGSALIGSGPDVDLSLSSQGVAPRHARFDVARLELESLDGAVEVDGRPLGPAGRATLESGSQVRIGESTLHLVVWQPDSARPLSSHPYLEQRGAEECLRGMRKKSAFSVVTVSSPQRARSAEVEAALASTIRLTDVLAAYAPGTYELLLFDTGPEGAAQVASRITRALAQVTAPGAVGVAHFPGDGLSIDVLLAHSRAATREAGPEGSEGGSPMVSSRDEMIERLALSELPVLILGETGSGKEVMASRIHQLSRRRAHPYVKFNCAAFTESLFESELFGHERGAFTGASGTKPGLLEAANGGTVFLDEVGEMPLAMQAKLLRALEQREVLRVGAVKPTPIDVRFVAATNRDLQAEVARGSFRPDLYFRLEGATVILPALRERLAEFPQLVRQLLTVVARRSKLARVPEVTPGAMELLMKYRWPGNVRELQNVLERASLMSDGGLIDRNHLPLEKLTSRFAEYDPRRFRAAAHPAPAPAIEPPAPAPAPAPPSPPAFEPPAPDRRGRRGLGLLLEGTERQQLAEQERQVIEQALLQCGGNQTQAARRLGISRQTLIKRIERYGLTRPRGGPEKGGRGAGP
ncbi:MAG: sigma 54-interacting transcriptional regulator [Archangiaceae bacterium]|nr:sigma 54-interacting transcriptional regulator [Archangiaceae bacterium]